MKTAAKQKLLTRLEADLAQAISGSVSLDAAWVDWGSLDFHYCEDCGRRARLESAVWLELNAHTGVYHPIGRTPKRQSQGCFTFHTICAVRRLAKLGGV